MKQINVYKLSVRPSRKLGCLVVKQAWVSSKNHKWSAGDASHLEVLVHEISTILWVKNREEPDYYSFYEKRIEKSQIENWSRANLCIIFSEVDDWDFNHSCNLLQWLFAEPTILKVPSWQYILQVKELESKLY